MRLRTRVGRFAGAVEVFDNVVENCSQILRVIEDNADWESARVGVDKGSIDVSVRSNNVTFFEPTRFDCHPVIHSMSKTVWHYVADYSARYGCPFSGMEGVNINRYSPGTFYKAHSDDGPGHSRVMSALLYLNDVEKGGETHFTLFDVAVEPKAGRLVIFPSNYAYSHAAIPPVSGVKYSAAFWMVK